MVIILDNFEYSSDDLARAAYLALLTDRLTGGTPSAMTYFEGNEASKACDDNPNTSWKGNPVPQWWMYDFGGNPKIITGYSLYSYGYGPTGWSFQGSDDNSNWITLDSQTSQNVSTKKYYYFINGTPYRYYRIYITTSTIYDFVYITEIEMFNDIAVFSESTIKVEGNYSLKCSAALLNVACTRTIAVPLDLSNENLIRFVIRSNVTGANIKLSIQDVGNVLTEITPTICVANVWQDIIWDISQVSNVNKDAINKIIITLVNADSPNTFYLDAMRTSVINNYLIDRGRSRTRMTPISLG